MIQRWGWMLALVATVMGGGSIGWALTNHEAAEQIANEANRSVQPMFGKESRSEKDGLFLLLSLSVPKEEFQRYMLEAKKLGARVVLRGFVENNFRKHITLIREVLDISQAPTERLSREFLTSLMVDPTLFEQAGVEEVPAWAYRSGKHVVVVHGGGTGEPLLKTLVTLDPAFASYRQWYDVRVGSWARRRDSENVAPPVLPELSAPHVVRFDGKKWPILEPDLLKFLKQRAKEVDWTQVENVMQKKAKEKIEKGPGLDLPVARESNVLFYDPSVEFTEDIIEPTSGHVLAPAGTKVNPLRHVTWQYEYAVFNPEDSDQVQVIQSWLKEKLAHEVKLLITRGNALEWAEKFQLPVYWAQPEIIQGLHVRVVPSVVSQKADRIQVAEMRP